MANPTRSEAKTVGATAEPATAPQADVQPSSLGAFLRYFLYLGTVGFGGPIALAGYMQRDLVEQRHWISDRDYKEGLALAQLAPGPLAAQLAIYLGWVRARVLGATAVGVAFVLPSFLMVLVIAALYVRYGGLPWMQGAFYGIGAAVIAIIAQSVLKLARLTLGRDRLLWAICLVSALVTAWTESEIFWLFVGSGVVALLVRARPRRSVTAASLVLASPPWLLIAAVPASAGVLWTILWYFAEAGLVVFGSGLAVVPFLHGGVVQQFHWLTERQFLDAVAVSMITPGPVVITVAFIGYLVAGLPGAVVAAIGIFVPCYLTVVLAAPYFHRFASNRSVKAFVDGVTAAATGAIAGAAFVLGRRAIVDVPTVLIALVALSLLFLPKRLPEPALILAAGIVGILMHGAAPPGAH
jgi:chromate transporter